MKSCSCEIVISLGLCVSKCSWGSVRKGLVHAELGLFDQIDVLISDDPGILAASSL